MSATTAAEHWGAGYEAGKEDAGAGREPGSLAGSTDWRFGYVQGYADGGDYAKGYRGPTCSHPHNLPYNDECAVWWLRGSPLWRQAHTNLGA
jgi:hypothetical protein